MKLTVAQMEDARANLTAIANRLQDEIDVQYRLERQFPRHEWGVSERECEFELWPEHENIVNLAKSIEPCTQIMGDDRYLELVELEPPMPKNCSRCGGTGRMYQDYCLTTCSQCDGTGE